MKKRPEEIQEEVEVLRKTIGEVVAKTMKADGVTMYRLQLALKRGQGMPSTDRIKAITENKADYTSTSLLIVLAALGIEVQLHKDGERLL